MAGDKYAKLRRRLYLALEGGTATGTLGALFDTLLFVLILLNVVAFILQSVPEVYLPARLGFEIFEALSVAVFTVEYGLRLWVAGENPMVREGGPILGRLKAALKPTMVTDFLAVAPVYFTVLFPVMDLRFLRLVRLIRLMKIVRYSPALSNLGRVLMAERRALFGTFILLLCATVFAGAAMHAVEGSIQPDKFGTIPSAMWWAITTLTTVGYGDGVPITFWGRMVAGFTMIVGLGVLALPVGIVANGFLNTLQKHDFIVTFGMLARVPLFRDLEARVLGDVMSALRSQSVAPGTIIAVEGASADAMYFIISGEVEAELPHRRVHFGAGDFFGELALLHQTHRRATIVAQSACRLLALSAADFAMLTRKHPHLRQHIEDAAKEHLRKYQGEGDLASAEITAAAERRFEYREDD